MDSYLAKNLLLVRRGNCKNISMVLPENFSDICHMFLISSAIFTNMCVSALLGMIAALRSFSLDKLHYWRESASGMSSLAYFLAKDTVDHFATIVKPGVYLSMFYFFNNPRSTIYDNYFVLVCLVYCVTGIAYALAIYFEAGSAQLVLT